MLKAAIVGLGRIASTFEEDPNRKHIATHAGAYDRLKGVKIVAGCDIDLERREKFRKRWKVEGLYTDFDQMLAKEKPDVVSICTWPGVHYDLVKKAVKAGVRGIFCEKPMTEDLAEADAIVNLCKKTKVVFAVNYTRRWDAGHIRIKKMLETGKLGSIKHASCYYTAGLFNTGSHMMDTLTLFLGRVQWVQMFRDGVVEGKEPTPTGVLAFENNVLVTLAGMNVKDYLMFDIDILGSKGRIHLTRSGYEQHLWKASPSSMYSGYRELAFQEKQYWGDHEERMLNGMKDFLSCVKTGAKPKSNEKNARDTFAILTACKKSFAKDKRVYLP